MKHYDFCSQKKKSSLFEVADVLPVMTNNFEDTIMKGVQVLGVFLVPSSPPAFDSIPRHTFPHAQGCQNRPATGAITSYFKVSAASNLGNTYPY